MSRNFYVNDCCHSLLTNAVLLQKRKKKAPCEAFYICARAYGKPGPLSDCRAVMCQCCHMKLEAPEGQKRPRRETGEQHQQTHFKTDKNGCTHGDPSDKVWHLKSDDYYVSSKHRQACDQEYHLNTKCIDCRKDLSRD